MSDPVEEDESLRRSLSTPDIVVLVVYFGIQVVIAGYFTWKQRKAENMNAKDFFLASRDNYWWAIGASFFASNIGSDALVGLTGSGAQV
jgi:SSS family solute:Na+ symporter